MLSSEQRSTANSENTPRVLQTNFRTCTKPKVRTVKGSGLGDRLSITSRTKPVTFVSAHTLALRFTQPPSPWVPWLITLLYERRSVKPTIHFPSTYTIVPREKSDGYPTGRILSALRASMDTGNKRNLCPGRKSNRGRHACSSLYTTELSILRNCIHFMSCYYERHNFLTITVASPSKVRADTFGLMDLRER
jgi:hypothetical protein